MPTGNWGGSSNGIILADRHNGGCNYAFVDGHVKWLVAVPDPNNASNNAFKMQAARDDLDYDCDGTTGGGTTTAANGYD